MITRLRAVWNGWSGGPGYSSIYCSGALATTGLDTAANAFKTWLTTMANYVPSGITLTIDSYANQIDEKTGIVQNVVSIPTPPAGVTGSSSSTFAAPAGAVVLWRTGVVNKRRLTVGRTFLVPLGTILFQSDGTIVDANKNAMITASNTLISALSGLTPGKMQVWRRPSAKGASDGAAIDVTAASVTDKAQVLRSRRGR